MTLLSIKKWGFTTHTILTPHCQAHLRSQNLFNFTKIFWYVCQGPGSNYEKLEVENLAVHRRKILSYK